MLRRRRIPLVNRINIARLNRSIPPINPRLIEANRLLNIGEFTSSAVIFQEVAEDALRRDGPQAPYLFALTAKAWLMGNQIDKAIIAFQKSFDILIVRKNWKRLKLISEQAFAQLHDTGYTKQEKELRSWLEANIPMNIKNLPAWNTVKQKSSFHTDFPSNCPQCGAPINEADLEWTGESANCNYCGSLLTRK